MRPERTRDLFIPEQRHQFRDLRHARRHGADARALRGRRARSAAHGRHPERRGPARLRAPSARRPRRRSARFLGGVTSKHKLTVETPPTCRTRCGPGAVQRVFVMPRRHPPSTRPPALTCCIGACPGRGDRSERRGRRPGCRRAARRDLESFARGEKRAARRGAGLGSPQPRDRGRARRNHPRRGRAREGRALRFHAAAHATATMSTRERIRTLEIDDWSSKLDAQHGDALCAELERGSVLLLPRLPFATLPGESRFLSEASAAGDRKNVSLRAGERGRERAARPRISTPWTNDGRYASAAARSSTASCRATRRTAGGATSFRPCRTGARVSWRHDDTRMHVDAFPSTPVGGRRILRVFTNVDPGARGPRTWNIGEPFAALRRAIPAARGAAHGRARRPASRLGNHQEPAQAYDHLMLQLHDAAKADTEYQSSAARLEFGFPRAPRGSPHRCGGAAPPRPPASSPSSSLLPGSRRHARAPRPPARGARGTHRAQARLGPPPRVASIYTASRRPRRFCPPQSNTYAESESPRSASRRGSRRCRRFPWYRA